MLNPWLSLQFIAISCRLSSRTAFYLTSSIFLSSLTSFPLPPEENHLYYMMLQPPCFIEGVVCTGWYVVLVQKLWILFCNTIFRMEMPQLRAVMLTSKFLNGTMRVCVCVCLFCSHLLGIIHTLLLLQKNKQKKTKHMLILTCGACENSIFFQFP